MARQQGIEQRIEDFMTALYKLYCLELSSVRIPDYVKPVEAEYGHKFARIVISVGGSRSVYCFINLTDGSILKADSWKKPAKGVRGSIWNDGFDVGPGKPCNVHGGGLYKK